MAKLDVLNPDAAVDVPDCACQTCRDACSYKPGWFLPGEAERVADHLGVSLNELFTTRLAVDYFSGGGERYIFVLSPVVVGNEPGEEFPFEPRGRCTFLAGGRCTIHAVKPFECRATIHSDTDAETRRRHEAIARSWEGRQEQIRALLGREPQPDAPEDDEDVMFGWSIF